MKKIYLRYLALTKIVHGTDYQLSAVNQNAKRLLEVIALSHAQNRPLTVSAAIAMAPAAYPHTPHRKPNLLHKRGGIYTAWITTKAYFTGFLRKPSKAPRSAS